MTIFHFLSREMLPIAHFPNSPEPIIPSLQFSNILPAVSTGMNEANSLGLCEPFEKSVWVSKGQIKQESLSGSSPDLIDDQNAVCDYHKSCVL